MDLLGISRVKPCTNIIEPHKPLVLLCNPKLVVHAGFALWNGFDVPKHHFKSIKLMY